MKKIIIAGMCVFIASQCFAKVEKVIAVGVGGTEYEATVDAIDNAIRQNSDVSVDGGSGKIIHAKYDLEDHEKYSDNDRVKVSAHADGSYSEDYADQESAGGTKKWWQFWKKSSYKSSAKANYNADVATDSKSSTDASIHEELSYAERDINMKYKGKIEGYKILEMKHKGKKYTAKIEAKIFVVDDYVSPDMVKKSEYRLAMTDFEGKRNWDCISDKMVVKPLQKQLVKSKKVTMVDRANFDKQMKELGLLNTDIANRENQSKLKQVAIADYILVGQIDSFNIKHTEKDIALTGEHVSKTDASLQISYKLIETATMDIVSSDSTTKSVHFDYNAGCNAVANRLVEQAGVDLADKMIEDVFGE